MKKLSKFKVSCYIPGHSWEETIEAREVTMDNGAYLFWRGEYGETNTLVISFPIMYTVVETVIEEEDTDDTKVKLQYKESEKIN
jgi:hypothetical protein